LLKLADETQHFMNKQIPFLVSALATMLLVAGCQTNSARAVKMQSQSGRVGHSIDYGWYAVCKTQTSGGHEGTWKGPLWRDKERAMQDALDHNKENAGHHAIVQHD
jgi:hypothetical protein